MEDTRTLFSARQMDLHFAKQALTITFWGGFEQASHPSIAGSGRLLSSILFCQKLVMSSLSPDYLHYNYNLMTCVRVARAQLYNCFLYKQVPGVSVRVIIPNFVAPSTVVLSNPSWSPGPSLHFIHENPCVL